MLNWRCIREEGTVQSLGFKNNIGQWAIDCLGHLPIKTMFYSLKQMVDNPNWMMNHDTFVDVNDDPIILTSLFYHKYKGGKVTASFNEQLTWADDDDKSTTLFTLKAGICWWRKSDGKIITLCDWGDSALGKVCFKTKGFLSWTLSKMIIMT